MKSNNNSFIANKRSADEYAQLWLWIHKSSDTIKQERHNMKESWSEIMKKMNTD